MKVAVAGGTGVAGRWTVQALRDTGHEPIVMARSTGVDLVTGSGLAEALVGVDAVVDATNSEVTKATDAEAFFGATACNLTAAARDADVGRVVALSIVGIDEIPYGYYIGKVRQEKELLAGGLPVSILRAAQFHEFAGQYIDRAKGRTIMVPKWRVAPVAAREVGMSLAELATGAYVERRELAGPQEAWLVDLVRQQLAADGLRRHVVQIRIPGRVGKGLACGRNVPGAGAFRGKQSFADWLVAQRPRSESAGAHTPST